MLGNGGFSNRREKLIIGYLVWNHVVIFTCVLSRHAQVGLITLLPTTFVMLLIVLWPTNRGNSKAARVPPPNRRSVPHHRPAKCCQLKNLTAGRSRSILVLYFVLRNPNDRKNQIGDLIEQYDSEILPAMGNYLAKQWLRTEVLMIVWDQLGPQIRKTFKTFIAITGLWQAASQVLRRLF
jgi:hypothetical protein